VLPRRCAGGTSHRLLWTPEVFVPVGNNRDNLKESFVGKPELSSRINSFAPILIVTQCGPGRLPQHHRDTPRMMEHTLVPLPAIPRSLPETQLSSVRDLRAKKSAGLTALADLAPGYRRSITGSDSGRIRPSCIPVCY